MSLETTINHFKELGMKPNYAELSRRYEKDQRTIKKYYLEGIPSKHTRTRASELDEHVEEIKVLLSKACTMKGIHRYLKIHKGLTTKYSNFKYYVQTNGLKKKIKKEEKVRMRYETPPGRQAQVDWKESVKLNNIHGEVFEVNVFAIVLSHSRKKYFELTLSKNQYTVFNCLIKAFREFGGVPETILFDNMRTISNHQPYNKRQINAKAKAFADDMGFEIKLCKIKSPQSKGKVETQMKFMDDLQIYNDKFETIEDLQEIVKKIQHEVNNEVSQGNNLIPNISFLKEKEYLKPLSKSLSETYLDDIMGRTVGADSTISFNGNKYSVPKKFVNKRVLAEQLNDELYIYYSTELISTHQISENKLNFKENHYREIMDSYPKSTFSDELEELIDTNLKNFDLIGEKNEN